MADWVRSFSANLIGSADSDLDGPADLDTDTAPGDFDPASVTAVRFQFTLSHTGTFDSGSGSDEYSLTPNSVVLEDTTDSTQLAVVNPTGLINVSTATVAIDLTDNSPVTGASTADWEGAQFNGAVVPAIATFSQNKGKDGVVPQILAASVTITITYTPSANIDLNTLSSTTFYSPQLDGTIDLTLFNGAATFFSPTVADSSIDLTAFTSTTFYAITLDGVIVLDEGHISAS